MSNDLPSNTPEWSKLQGPALACRITSTPPEGSRWLLWELGLLKPREERRKVLTQARMRCGATWSDVCIVNLSTRGVGLQSAAAPSRGTYVELRRGSNVIIIGQVVWSKDQRFGVRTQDQVWIDGVLSDAGVASAPKEEWRERRAMPRQQSDSDRSRLHGRWLQYAFGVMGGLCATATVGSLVDAAFAQPMQSLSAILANPGAQR